MGGVKDVEMRMFCWCFAVVVFITGIVCAGLGSDNETDWHHVPLCHNVKFSDCPVADVSLQTTPTGGYNQKETSGGCCRTYRLNTDAYRGYKTATAISRTAAYPAERLESKWFGASEFRSGAPEFFDYTGARSSTTPSRAFSGQCAPQLDTTAASNATGFTYKYKIPKTLSNGEPGKLTKGFKYMPKVLHTDGLTILSLIVKVNAGSKGTRTYDLSPVPGQVTSSFPYKCNPAPKFDFLDDSKFKGPVQTVSVGSSSADRRLSEEKIASKQTMKRRRTLLKGGSSWGSSSTSSSRSSRSSRSSSSSRSSRSSSYNTGGYESSSRNRRGTNYVYMSTTSRTRTRYGYTDKTHVQAEFDGTILPTIIFPENSAQKKSINGLEGKTFTKKTFFAESAILTGRNSYVGSKPGKAGACTCPTTFRGDGECDTQCNSEKCNWDGGDCKPPSNWVKSTTGSTTGVTDFNQASLYYQHFSYQEAVKVSDPRKPITLYEDLSGSQFGEDDDLKNLLEFDGVSDWEFEVSFRGEYNPINKMESTTKTMNSFPHVYITFVTPDTSSFHILSTILIIGGILIFGLSCTEALECGCLETDDNATSSRSTNNYSSRSGGWSDTNKPTTLIPPAGATIPSDDAFRLVVRNSAINETRGEGSNVKRDDNGDHSRIPTGRCYTAVILRSNDIRSLKGAQDHYLQHINVHNNDISKLEGIHQFDSLQTLIITNNNLKNINSYGIASNLKVLDVSCNDIKSLFGGNPGYTAYPNLTVFVALNNDISNFVGLSQNCPCLKVLDLRNNDLTQNVFDELSSMHNLTHVNLCNNDIKSTEGDLIRFAQNCSNTLVHLNIAANDIKKSELAQLRDTFKRRGMTLMIVADDKSEQVVGASFTGPAVVPIVVGTANPMPVVAVVANPGNPMPVVAVSMPGSGGQYDYKKE